MLPTLSSDVPVLWQVEPWVRSLASGVGAVISWALWHAIGART
jgi:hypothetical protein